MDLVPWTVERSLGLSLVYGAVWTGKEYSSFILFLVFFQKFC